MPARFNPNKFAEAAENTIKVSQDKQAKLQEKVDKAQARVDKANEGLLKAQDALEAEKASAVEAQEYLDGRTARANAAAASENEVDATV